MAILQIRTFPDSCLHAPSRPVERITPAVERLIRDLIETMRHHPRCVGLAASQVGSDASVAVVDVTGHPKVFPRSARDFALPGSTSGLLVLVNPQITAQETWTIQREGCLSVPDFTGNVRRASRLHVSALDERGEPWTRWVDGFEAIAVQHEADHLAGRLFLDRIANVRTDVFRRKRYW
ncbi:MAG: peptide deformylase [Candidatus Omnitrophica bacterium]|nr:peptide deformylase [Candidatus Omnitrophota bacterium]